MLSKLRDINSRVLQGCSFNFKSEAQEAKENPCNMPTAKYMKLIDQKTFTNLILFFNACYFLLKNNRQFSDFKELVELLLKYDV